MSAPPSLFHNSAPLLPVWWHVWVLCPTSLHSMGCCPQATLRVQQGFVVCTVERLLQAAASCLRAASLPVNHFQGPYCHTKPSRPGLIRPAKGAPGVLKLEYYVVCKCWVRFTCLRPGLQGLPAKDTADLGCTRLSQHRSCLEEASESGRSLWDAVCSQVHAVGLANRRKMGN